MILHSCATLCVSFSSKSKAINVFPKHILKSKACDHSIQARNCFVMRIICATFRESFGQNRKHMEAQNQRTDTPADFKVPW